MNLATIDWLIIFAYLAIAVIIGAVFSRKAGKSVEDYFVAGRSLPWWLAGMTMVASSFAIDTPLGITGMVAGHGIQGVWYAWSFVLSGAGALGAFIFASLLRRSEAITAAELIELRYSGKEAAGLRLFKSVYFGVGLNAITLGSIIKAVWTVTDVVLGWNPHVTLAVVLSVTLLYTTMAGMWGIAATDFLQFFVGFAGLMTLLWFALDYVGGMPGLMTAFNERYGEQAGERLQFFPRPGSPFFETFLVFILFKWWNNPPSAIHQRIVSSKDEKHASLATLTFAVMQFAINYWPMILIAMVSLVVFPDLPLADAEQGYPMLIVELIPSGILGLLLAAMMAAFMSTVDTHINFGASYLVNDIYRRFIKRDASTEHYVKASRVSTVIMLAVSVVVAYNLDSVSQAWYYLAMVTAGYGVLVVVRWFWWRINAWSEISALAASGVLSTLMSHRFAKAVGAWFPSLEGYSDLVTSMSYGWRFLTVLGGCTVVWLIVTYKTKPSDHDHLVAFCTKVKPFPTFWGPIHKEHPEINWNPYFRRSMLQFIFGSAAIYGITFGVGNWIFGHAALGIGMLVTSLAVFGIILSTWKVGA